MTLRHITLNSGHVRRCARTEVTDDAIAAVAPMLAAPDGVHRSMQPPFERYKTSVSAQADALLVTIWGRNGAPLVTFGVAPTVEAAADLWPLLTQQGEDHHIPVAASRPATPWCAALLRPTIALDEAQGRDVMRWAGDFERCVAWCWIGARGLT